ncbi:MAG: hypothetical protein WBV73_28880 [Phormidium sp.]
MKEITVEIANINDAVSLPPPIDLFSKPLVADFLTTDFLQSKLHLLKKKGGAILWEA